VANPPFRLIGLPVLCLWTTTVSAYGNSLHLVKLILLCATHGTPAGR
jgi:hypothetical protein